MNENLLKIFEEIDDDLDLQDELGIENVSMKEEKLVVQRDSLDKDEDTIKEIANAWVVNNAGQIDIMQEVLSEKRFASKDDALNAIKKLESQALGAGVTCKFATDKDDNVFAIKATCTKKWDISVPKDTDDFTSILDKKSDELYKVIKSKINF